MNNFSFLSVAMKHISGKFSRKLEKIWLYFKQKIQFQHMF